MYGFHKYSRVTLFSYKIIDMNQVSISVINNICAKLFMVGTCIMIAPHLANY